MNDKEDYEVKLADGRRFWPKDVEYTEKGIRFPVKGNHWRFVPYAALLWVDFRV